MHDSSHSSTQILDKRLRIEMAILREMFSNKEITEIFLGAQHSPDC